jgi:hypothetical protein
MKVTNFGISKKLKEIVFEAYTEFYHIADENCLSQGIDSDDYEVKYLNIEDLHILRKSFYYSAYDLETLLDVLPDSIKTDNCSFEEYLQISKNEIGYYSNMCIDSIFSVEKQENESLADVAGRLLILLHEKGIIKYNL